jgi:hypothetical protein
MGDGWRNARDSGPESVGYIGGTTGGILGSLGLNLSGIYGEVVGEEKEKERADVT